MEQRRAAGIIIFEKQGKTFLMGERADGQGWGFAAGKQDAEDADLQVTALRELREEFGVTLSEKQLNQLRFHKTILCRYAKIERESKKILSWHFILSDIFYLGVADKHQIQYNLALTDGEVTDIRWLTLNEISSCNIFAPSLIALNTLNLDFATMLSKTQ